MLNHKLILFFLFSCFTVTLQAQDIYFSNYPQHQFFYNPAFAGTDSTHDFSVSGRTQFDNISSEGYYDAVFTYNQPIGNSKSGIGGIVAYQQNSYSNRYQLALAYNYKFKLAEKMNLRIGASALQEFYHQDATISTWQGTSEIDINFFDACAGFEYDWNNFFLGLSVKHVLAKKQSLKHDMNVVYAAKNFTSGYKINICKSFSSTPSILYILQGPAQEFQVANDMCFKKTFLLGCGAIYNEAVSIRGGICLKNKFQAVVSYDIATSTLARPTNNQGAFEANIQYRF